MVALVASAQRISQVRQNRVIEQSHSHLEDYVDRDAIAAEIAQTRQLCARYGWPIIDVTRRSIEETAAAIIRLYSDREAPVRSMSGFLQAGRPPLILASTSKIRARMLEAAGLAFIVEPPGLDETVMRQAVSGERSLSSSRRCRGAGAGQGRSGERPRPQSLCDWRRSGARLRR